MERFFLTSVYVQGLKRPHPENCESVKLFSNNELVEEYNREVILHIANDLLNVNLRKQNNLNIWISAKIIWLKKGTPVILLRNSSNKLVNQP